jgi:hypothetical protein
MVSMAQASISSNMPARHMWLSLHADNSEDEVEMDSSDEFEGMFVALACKQI